MKLYALTLRGKRKEWVILADFSRDCYDDIADGCLVSRVGEVINTIPEWYVDLGLPVKLWCAVQDLVNKCSG